MTNRSAGLMTAAVAVAASTATGAATAAVFSDRSPVDAVATRVIDSVPGGVRDWAIDVFGTQDKLVLGAGIVIVLFAAATGVARRSAASPRIVPAAIATLALVGLAAYGSVGPAEIASLTASAAIAWFAFTWLRPPSVAASPDTAPPAAEPMVTSRWEAAVDRRSFVGRTGALWAGTAALSGVAMGVNRSESESQTIARRSFPIIDPSSADAAAPIDAGATVSEQTSPFLTPVEDFYRIDTAFLAPRLSVDSWRLTIDGAVDRPLELTYDDLLDRHIVERVITLCCVSNEVGGDLVGTSTFMGVPLAELLEEVGVRPEGTQIAMTSSDGWTCGFPTEVALDGRDAMVAIGMAGEPLTVTHGFPARIVVPGLYGYVSATKWITQITLTGWDDFDGYWIPRGWSKEGPVKTQSRIDVPADGADLAAGTVAVAGIAFAQHRGIEGVEVRIDDGDWEPARVGTDVSDDAWRQWVYEWTATPGSHRIAVRATDKDGETQTADLAEPAPDGATGHHTIEVTVS